MQRVDAGYLYEVGDAVRCIAPLGQRNAAPYEIWSTLINCRHKVADFLSNSVYCRSLHPIVHLHARAIITAIDNLTDRIAVEKLEIIEPYDLMPVKDAYERFEPVFQAELSRLVLYLITPKGAYDLITLVEDGSKLFPISVHNKCPEATQDIIEGAKALAFELWTAAGFHFHRANESVLRRYYDLHKGKENRPKVCTMGTMLKKLEDDALGEKQVIVALQNITKFHRNPNSHPGHFVADSEQAFSLVAAIRASMDYMLEELDNVEDIDVTPVTFPPLEATSLLATLRGN